MGGTEEENIIAEDPGGAAALPHFEEVAHSFEEVKNFYIDFISEEGAPAGVVIKREERRARVLFLYPGEKRRSPITSSLGEALGGDKVQVVVVDVLKHGADSSVRGVSEVEALKLSIYRGSYDYIIVQTPSKTFGREVYKCEEGPPPVSSMFPLGFPWNQGKHRKRAKFANQIMDLTLKLFR